jgi:hypothetical protein
LRFATLQKMFGEDFFFGGLQKRSKATKNAADTFQGPL